jgi:hypothetical protein
VIETCYFQRPPRTDARPPPRSQSSLDPLTRGYLSAQPKETIAIEQGPCYPVAMTHYFEDRLQRQWRPRLLPSQAFLPHELVNGANEIGRIYTDVIGKPARAVRMVIEDDETTPDVRFELGPASGVRPGPD